MKLYWSKSLGHGFRIGGRIGGNSRRRTRTKNLYKESKSDKASLTLEQKNRRKLIWGIILIAAGGIALIQVGEIEKDVVGYVAVCLAFIGGGIALIATRKKNDE